MLWLCWHIWKARNDYIFNHVPVDPTEVIFKAARDAMEFVTAQVMLATSPSVFRQASGVNQAWVSSAQGTFRVNCDVAIQPDTKVGAVVALLRNDQGTLLDGVAMKAAIASVLQGEVLAIRLACVMCDTLHLSRAEVEGDNQGVIKLSVSEDAPPWECAALVADIKALAHKRGLSFRWCPRSANSAANWVALARLGGYLPVNWVTCPPLLLVSSLSMNES
ncbi:uncharacterized protein LOC114279770 [Camellia sinensis]|uniref:uncharacterized protein LOC114279770 n=1 Tax=Camellia sinensis TaxID=4442 RepID=UPI0010355A93|nr:uncharacterized protein LOC114279770 [Camellia sinensis]